VLDILAQGDLQPALTTVAFAELNQAYDRFGSGHVVGRMVTRPWD
jgi:D-arabinose 1-dehydrogenase-like Zn-dependent alcohol dehydrogenase